MDRCPSRDDSGWSKAEVVQFLFVMVTNFTRSKVLFEAEERMSRRRDWFRLILARALAAQTIARGSAGERVDARYLVARSRAASRHASSMRSHEDHDDSPLSGPPRPT